MRRHGGLGTAKDLGMHDHACWMALAERAGCLGDRHGIRFQNVPHPVVRLSEVMGVAL